MRNWIMTTIRTNKQASDMVKLFKERTPKYGAFDTETDGLHIIMSKPFLFQFGWLDPENNNGYTFAVDIERQPDLSRQVIKAWHKLAKGLDKYFAHNTKFDLHMLTNYGEPYLEENLSDTMFYIRFAHDALTPKNGGPPMKLKEYAARYITPDAKSHDRLLQVERSAIAKSLNIKLKQRLSLCGSPPKEYGAASYTIGVIEKIFKDPIADWKSLPSRAAQEAYQAWLNIDVPLEIRNNVTGLVETDMIPYHWCNRDNLIKYAHYDIVYVLEIVEKLIPVITARDNWHGVEIEESLILPLYEMERVGFKVDIDYLKTCKENMKAYIVERRAELSQCVGQKLSVGQNQKILEILRGYGLPIDSTGDEIISKAHTDLLHSDPENPAIKIIELIQELRTLEKWYSTYIIRFLKDLKKTDRLYTTINSVGAVSGRVTSDFQQFPKVGIQTHDGKELFHPRRMIQVTGGDYDKIVYLDYSQIELRFQALYTILVGHPDLNLCRAYMPYKCINPEGHVFDYNNPEDIKNWNKEWYYEEDPTKHWVATDVHGATTEAATGLTPDHPDFKLLRSKIGKRVNFAKNYGAQFKKIWSMFPDVSEEEAHRIDNAYYTAFPGVKEYHNYCYQRADYFAYTQNLFGIKYYGLSGHKLINTLVQGSAAYYLKLKIRELYDYQKANGIKTRWQMQIHDELSWEHHVDDDLSVFFEFKRIMQDWPDAIVPLVAEMEVTKTNWAEKKGVETLEELKAV